jgi:hypothetical protein
MSESNLCDKCGEVVEAANNAVLVYLEAGFGTPTTSARHLVRTKTCEGSPSLAQYLEGQPRDSRPWYPLNIYYVQKVREAYKRVVMKSNAK